MKIVLLGYMASGKSLIGKKIAEVLNFKFIDLDDYIEKKENQNIKTIFLEKGEIYFRKIEHAYLKEVLATNSNCVLSLGGGTPCYYNNMQLLLEDDRTQTVYLKVPIGDLVKRLINEQDNRPVISHLKTKDALTEFVGKHLFERSGFYNKARIKIDANTSVNEIVETLVSKLF